MSLFKTLANFARAFNEGYDESARQQRAEQEARENCYHCKYLSYDSSWDHWCCYWGYREPEKYSKNETAQLKKCRCSSFEAE